MEKQQLAAGVLKALGGADNLIKLSYCASRIRVTIRNNACFDRHALETLDAIKSVLEVDTAQHSTEYHLVVGPGNSRSLYEALTGLTDHRR
ncbi:PTS transporter subunit EIIB [Erwinia rhapontici]|uniref:PTS transporter subunit EIIB n=1 Tax=Erwinia rhapontici TaxID=55212 RepID=UPI001331BEF7|nr:PTS transporter subunit EIIB [Erwinia rhapontici]MBP2156432.1 PTS system sucrose-specific IIC component [Erwinia rhapontici]